MSLGGRQADCITNTSEKVKTETGKFKTKNSDYRNRLFVISVNHLEIKGLKNRYIHYFCSDLNLVLPR